MNTLGDRVRSCIVYQTDPALSPALNRFGCRVMTLLGIPQFVTGSCLSVADIADIVERGRGEPGVIVNNEMKCGPNEHWLINEGFRALGASRAGRQVGWDESHISVRRWQYMICHWETDGPDGHFTLHDRLQHEIYDPHNPEQAGYEVNKKRIARRLIYSTWEA